MEVEVTMFILTPLTCWDASRRKELMFQSSSGNSTALCPTEGNNSPRWCQTRCCDRVHGGTLGTACYWSCSPVLLHRLPLFSFSLMEKQTSVAIAGMQHFESARERWAASDRSLRKLLQNSDIVAPTFLLEGGVTGMTLGTATLPQARNTLNLYEDKELYSSLRHL